MFTLVKAVNETKPAHRSESDGKHNKSKRVSVTMLEKELEKLRVKIMEDQSLALENALSKINLTTELKNLKAQLDSLEVRFELQTDDLLTLEADVIENNDEILAKHNRLVKQQKEDILDLRNHVQKLLGVEIQN